MINPAALGPMGANPFTKPRNTVSGSNPIDEISTSKAEETNRGTITIDG